MAKWTIKGQKNLEKRKVKLPIFEDEMIVYIENLKEITTTTVGSQHEELSPWQRSWGRKLGIRKGMIKPQETPCSRASAPKTRVLYGELSSITIFLIEGVNLQLQLIKIPGRDWTLKILWPAWSGSSGRMWLFTASQLWEARDALKLSKYRLFWEVRKLLV